MVGEFRTGQDQLLELMNLQYFNVILLPVGASVFCTYGECKGRGRIRGMTEESNASTKPLTLRRHCVVDTGVMITP
jgi:hypothetical protein